jgi:large subunit ribosomal protein L10
MEGITPFLTGPKVLAFTGGDGVALAKVLKEFIKTHPELQFEQAFLEGQILEAKEAEKIAELPSRDELITKLVNLLQSPIRRLAVALNAPLQQIATVVSQIAEKGGEGPEEPEESPKAEAAPEESDKVEDASQAEEKPQEAQASDESEEPQETEAPEETQETKETQES